jgi:hypothetical protein
MRHARERRSMLSKFQLDTLKGTDHFRDLSVEMSECIWIRDYWRTVADKVLKLWGR